jgi:hypothetical protein
MKFENLKTNRWVAKPAKLMIDIYQDLWPGWTIVDNNGYDSDRYEGIDYYIIKGDGYNNHENTITIQQKIRKIDYLKKYGAELTVEIANGNGTPAEWDYNRSKYYMLAYASDIIEQYHLIDISRLKEIVNKKGGIKRMGAIKTNREHGSASFVAIRMDRIKDAIIKEWQK